MLPSTVYASETLLPALKTAFSWLHILAQTQFLFRWRELQIQLQTFGGQELLQLLWGATDETVVAGHDP